MSEDPPADRPDGGGGALGRLGRATVWMAAGTGISRLTGLLRVLALAYALGATHLATSFNLANTTPNMIYDVVLGGVLSATFIPVFVDWLSTRGAREGWRAISAIVSLSSVVLVVMTVVFLAAAPAVIDAFTSLGHSTGLRGVNLAQEQAVATQLLRWFVPQVALYGFIALLTALLNTRRRFVAPMWVPIANNLVCIGVLLWFAKLTHTPSLAGARAHPSWVVLLGLGTTLGVALQLALLVLVARRVGFSGLRWRWNPRHEAVRTVLRLGGWTFGFVVANQVALFVVLALAVGVPGPDPVSSYTYAYTFMQMPYAVVAVSVMSAVTPGLSERWATGDVNGFRHRLTGGLRAVLTIILPAAMGMFILAKPVVDLLFAHGSYSVTAASTTGSTLAMFSLGLPGFCTFLYCVRAFQSMQRTRVAFWLYLLENGVNVVLAVALVHPLGVRGLALSLSVAYTVAAVAALAVLRGWLGRLGDRRTWAPLRRSVTATVVMGVVVLVVSNLSGADHGLALLARVVGSVAVGAVVFVAVSVVLGRRAERTGRAAPDEGRLVARAGPDRTGRSGRPHHSGRSDRQRRSLGYEGGIAYESGMGPGTGMVPPVGQLAATRRPWSGSGLGPIYRAGSTPTPTRPADGAGTGGAPGPSPYDAEGPGGPGRTGRTGDPDQQGPEN